MLIARVGVVVGLLVLSFVQGGCGSRPDAVVSPSGPLVIAHRGASGYLPEHTLSAYTLAIAQGADFIEPDVVLSRDGELVCAHDLTMEKVTDVAKKFPGRRRENGRWYWIDFDLYEIKQLSRTGPLPKASAGEGTQLRGHTVCTLDEVIDLVQHMSFVQGREIGIIPEPKDPGFHAENDRPIENILLGALTSRGYASPESAAIVQCFSLESLEKLTELAGGRRRLPRLVWLVSETPGDEELDRASQICHGIGPRKTLLENEDRLPRRLLIDLRSRGLASYPWTFGDDLAELARFLNRHEVSGVFTDNPDAALAARER